MSIANFTKLLTFPFVLPQCGGTQPSDSETSSALVSRPNTVLSKSSKFIRGIILRPSTLTGGKRQSSYKEEKEISEDTKEADEKVGVPVAGKKNHLQTKDVKKITRQDLINGKYDHLQAKPIRRSASSPSGHRSHGQKDSHRRNGHHHSSRSRSSRSSMKSKSPRQTSPLKPALIDDEFEGNELYIPSHQQTLANNHSKLVKRASDSDVVLLNQSSRTSTTYEGDGLLSLPVQRTTTLESDVSDYVSMK